MTTLLFILPWVASVCGAVMIGKALRLWEIQPGISDSRKRILALMSASILFPSFARAQAVDLQTAVESGNAIIMYLSGTLAAVGITLYLAWQLEGGAAAVNAMGSQRMRSYHIGMLLAEQAARPAAQEQLAAAVRTEEATLDARFAGEYTAYREGRAQPVERRFSWARVRANREYRAVTGFIAAFLLLAVLM